MQQLTVLRHHNELNIEATLNYHIHLFLQYITDYCINRMYMQARTHIHTNPVGYIQTHTHSRYVMAITPLYP